MVFREFPTRESALSCLPAKRPRPRVCVHCNSGCNLPLRRSEFVEPFSSKDVCDPMTRNSTAEADPWPCQRRLPLTRRGSSAGEIYHRSLKPPPQLSHFDVLFPFVLDRSCRFGTTIFMKRRGQEWWRYERQRQDCHGK